MNKTKLSILAASCLLALGAAAEPSASEAAVIKHFGEQEPTIIRLWPDDSERAKSRNGKSETATLTDKMRVTNVENPALMVYPPPAGVKNTGAAIIYCPGGGYGHLTMSNPKQFAEWMAPLGITVATLKYHVPRSKADPQHQWPLADLQRAVRLLRSRAAEFAISPDKIGVSGSSAGGHLAFNLCVNHGSSAYPAVDDVDALSSRPSFGILFYPAYLSKGLELGKPLAAALATSKNTPPIFITANADDRFVPGSFAAMLALNDAKVPAEFHLWSRGGHGGKFDKYPLAEFARPAARFLARRGFLPADSLAASDTWLAATIGKLRPAPGQTAAPPAPAPPAGLPASEWSPIDRKLQEAAGDKGRVYRLWPGEGRRADDPLPSKEETLTARNVPVASDVTVPTMSYFPAAKPNGRSVVVFPGGGYGVLAWEHEGSQVAQWLNEQGVTAFVLKYRTPRRQGLAKHQVALQDAQRAVRLVRSQAASFGLDPARIGVLGFSAGGHLAALAASQLPQASYEPIDEHDKVSPIANFGILIYPAYTTPSPATDELDPLLAGSKFAGPVFVASAADDKHTRGQYFFLYKRLQDKTPLSYHVYENGGHGGGILDRGKAYAQWPRECASWLQDLDRKN